MPAEARDTALALGARSSQLHSIISSAVVTDASGSPAEIDMALRVILAQLYSLRQRRGGLFVVGNGGSASVASHAVTDFLNVSGLRAMSLHDSSLLTCMSNDYGYENAFARILSVLGSPGDALIAISSSGKSPNICNAVSAIRALGGIVVTLSGFAPDNALRALGDTNIWLDSRDYGMVEIGHQFVLHNLADRLSLELKADVKR